mmetsp:Transcript_29466/g.62750  ORF Transcript_29466/g.62750 Transcript_29466/m.62750 type:complete len:269 (+) Transcript_29466:75-881(+)|eukprot:CAMPEP_0180468742 /NCGR_PEP_ID=MMETSP1036_2-20121128/27688_1 /TAXON_ID=632150 /ORGANISM="Azadinium spinosum, Strain 3D9" /LENGTH=268 /DNA_ID=CAMNT_0022475777 /DNA_START=67 /DNA_END=873 /DNA_ORIENTATION=-
MVKAMKTARAVDGRTKPGRTTIKSSKLTFDAWIKDPKPPPSPAQVRAKLRRLMTHRGMEAKDVRALIGGHSDASWSKLMAGKYKGGVNGAGGNEAYQTASFFFWKEEQLGAEGKLAAVAKNAKATLPAKDPFPDISKVKTDGKTYLTPQETRKELHRILKKYKVTQSDFAKMVKASSITKFMKAGGEMGGCESESYDGLAQICEKVRIATGLPKSKKRLALEKEVGKSKRRPFLGVKPNMGMLLSSDEIAYVTKDKLGRNVIKIERKR